MSNNESNDITETIALAEQLLSEYFSQKITLSSSESLSNQFLVLRVKVYAEKDVELSSVIIKKIYLRSKEAKANDQLKNRFLNELASLEFLNSLKFEPIIFPKLLTYNLENLLFIMNDIGNLPSVMDLLNKGTYDSALDAGKKYSKTLAMLHGITINKKEEFRSFQKKFASYTPPCDSNIKFKKYSDQFREFLSKFEKDNKNLQNFFEELNKVEKDIHDNLLIQSFIHCDSGPQNVLYAENKENCYLLDLEFGGYGFSYLDMAGPRIAFQQSMKGVRIPESEIKIIEREYLLELNKYLKNKILESDFKRVIWLSSSQWVIGRLGYYLKNVLLPILRSNNKKDPKIAFTEKKIKEISCKEYTLLVEYQKTSRELAIESELSRIIELTLSVIRDYWPNIKPLPYFPTFMPK